MTFRITDRGGTPLYKLCRFVPPNRVGFLRRFVCKRVYTLPILVWNRVWFSGELRECVNVFIIAIPNEYKKEGEICELEMDLMSLFVFALI